MATARVVASRMARILPEPEVGFSCTTNTSRRVAVYVEAMQTNLLTSYREILPVSTFGLSGT